MGPPPNRPSSRSGTPGASPRRLGGSPELNHAIQVLGFNQPFETLNEGQKAQVSNLINQNRQQQQHQQQFGGPPHGMMMQQKRPGSPLVR